MNSIADDPFSCNAWYSRAIRIAAIGAVVTLIFAIWWFMETGKCCGVVRFYEYALGGFVVVSCVTGNAVGLGVSRVGRRRKAKTLAMLGCIIAILTNAGMLIFGAKLLHDHPNSAVVRSDSAQPGAATREPLAPPPPGR